MLFQDIKTERDLDLLKRRITTDKTLYARIVELRQYIHPKQNKPASEGQNEPQESILEQNPAVPEVVHGPRMPTNAEMLALYPFAPSCSDDVHALLAAEIAAAGPRYATVMLGTNDIGYDNILRFGDDMVDIAEILIAAGVVPIFSSIPPRDDSAAADAWVPRYNAVVRGDVEAIRIGQQTNIQDLCVLHTDFGLPCLLGDRVSLGHGAIVHGAIVEDACLVGMGAIVLNYAVVGQGSVIGAGAVVTPNTKIPPYSLVLGSPGKVKRTLSEAERKEYRQSAPNYIQLAEQYRKIFR